MNSFYALFLAGGIFLGLLAGIGIFSNCHVLIKKIIVILCSFTMGFGITCFFSLATVRIASKFTEDATAVMSVPLIFGVGCMYYSSKIFKDLFPKEKEIKNE